MGDRPRAAHEAVQQLARKLAAAQEVAQLPGLHDEPESVTLAYSVIEIGESCRRLLELIEGLHEGLPSSQEETLSELREELRHILYHVHDSAYLSVIEPVTTDGASPG